MKVQRITVEQFEQDFKGLTVNHAKEVGGGHVKGKPSPNFELYKTISDQGYLLITAAYDGDTPVGYVIGSASPLHYIEDGWLVAIMGLYTHPDYRGRGVAKRLMTKYEKECKKAGIQVLHLTIMSEDTGAKAVVDAMGMSYVETTYGKRI